MRQSSSSPFEQPAKTGAVVSVIGRGLLACLLLCSANIASEAFSSDSPDGALAAQLAVRSESLRNNDPAALELSALLGAESLIRLPGSDGDYALRSAISIMRKPIRTVHHGDIINSAAVSFDGQWLATASDDQWLQIVPVGEGDPLPPLPQNHRPTRVLFSPERNIVAIMSGDILGLEDIDRKSEFKRVPVGGTIISANFGGNSRVAVGTANKLAKVFDANTGAEVASFPRPEAVRSVALDSQGNRLATATGTHVQIASISEKKDLFDLKHGGAVRMVIFNPQGSLLASASEDHNARLFNAQTGMPFGQPLHHEAPVVAVAFSEDGQLLGTLDEDGVVRIFHVAEECKELLQLPRQPGLTAIAFAAMGKILLTAGADHTARVYESSSGRETSRLVQAGPVSSLAVTDKPVPTLVAAGGKVAQVYRITRAHDAVALWGLRNITRAAFASNGQLLIADKEDAHLFGLNGAPLEGAPKADYPINLVAYSGQYIAMAKQHGTTQVVDLFDGKISRQITQSSEMERRPVAALAMSQNHALLAVAGNDTQSQGQEQAYLSLFATSSGKQQGAPKTCLGLAQSAALSPNGAYAAVGTSNQACVFQLGRSFELLFLHHEKIRASNFSPDNHFIAFGTESGYVYVFDMAGNTIFTSPAHENAVTQVLFDEDSVRLASLTSSGQLRVFDVVKKIQTNGFAALEVKAFTFNNQHLVTLAVDEEGPILQTHPLLPVDLLRQACYFALTRNLNKAEWESYIGPGDPRRTCRNLP